MKLNNLANLGKEQSCGVCHLKFHDDQGNLTEDLKYFMLVREDEWFVDSHLNQCLITKNHQSTIQCQICGESMKRFLRLRHNLQHHRDDLARCNECGEWRLRRELALHRRRKHRNHLAKSAQSIFVCPTCGKKFAKKRLYQSHLVRHWEKKMSMTGKKWY